MFTGNNSNKPGQAKVGHQLRPIVVFHVLLLVKEVLVDSASTKQPDVAVISDGALDQTNQSLVLFCVNQSE